MVGKSARVDRIRTHCVYFNFGLQIYTPAHGHTSRLCYIKLRWRLGKGAATAFALVCDVTSGEVHGVRRASISGEADHSLYIERLHGACHQHGTSRAAKKELRKKRVEKSFSKASKMSFRN